MKDLWLSEEGTFGTSRLVLVDTEKWTEKDWEELDDCADWDRFQTAIDISERRGSEHDYA